MGWVLVLDLTFAMISSIEKFKGRTQQQKEQGRSLTASLQVSSLDRGVVEHRQLLRFGHAYRAILLPLRHLVWCDVRCLVVHGVDRRRNACHVLHLKAQGFVLDA